MFRYIKPSRTVSKSHICDKLNKLTKQSDTRMLLDRDGKVYKFKFTVEQFATRRQAFDMLNKAQTLPNWQSYFEEV